MTAILVLASIFEVAVFPGIDTVVGCVVTAVSTWLYFVYVLQIEVIRRRPVSFVAFTALFLFMYLPLPVTLLDGTSMSHDLFNPVWTYILQLLYYIIAIVAFNYGGRLCRRHRELSHIFARWGLFTPPSVAQIWALGVIGWVFKFILLTQQGMVGKGSVSMFAVFIYAPISILFKHLWGQAKPTRYEQGIIYGYIIAVSLILIATNSRSQMLSPYVIYACGYLIEKTYERGERLWLNARKLFLAIVGFIIIAGPLSDLAYAMVIVRSIRNDVRFTELLSKSFDTFQDREAIDKARSAANKHIGGTIGFEWHEKYVSNIFLDRLCNYRVVDASIMHAERVGTPNEEMIEDFLTRMQMVYPTPIMRFLYGDIDKTEYKYSSQDKLYALSYSCSLSHGYRVGGDVGLGLAVFGYIYFIVVFIVYAIIFFIYDSLTYYSSGRVFIPFFVIMNIYFTYFLTFSVAGGMAKHISFLIWGFWWTMLWHLVMYKIVRIIVS